MLKSDIERQIEAQALLNSRATKAVELSMKAMEASTATGPMVPTGWNISKVEEALKYAQLASEYRRLAALAEAISS